MLDSESLVFPEADACSPIRAMHSLQENHVSILATALAQLPGMWSLERHECYDGNLILMLTLQQQDMRSIVVIRDKNGFHFSTYQNDKYWKLGCCVTLKELIATLQSSIITAMKRDRTI